MKPAAGKPVAQYAVDYVLAIAAVVAATMARWLIDPALGNHLPYVTYFVAVALVAWYTGVWPAISTMLLGWIVADYLFVPPRRALIGGNDDPVFLVGTAIYFMVAIVTILASGAMHSARRRTEAHREALRVTLASIGDAVITTDTRGVVTFMNSVAESLTGWTNSEADGRRIEEVFHIINEKSRSIIPNPAKRCLRNGAVVGQVNHTVLVAKDGAERPIDDSAAPIRNAEGVVIGCVLVFRDVSQRKQAERVVREREHHFRNLADHAPTTLWLTDADGRCTYLSKRWYDYTGRSPADDLGFGWLENLHPDDYENAKNVFLAANQRHIPFTLDYRLRGRDGEYRWMCAAGLPRYDESGQFAGYVGSVTDVHDRISAAEAVKASEARYRAIGEAIDFGVWMCDAEGRNTYASPSFLRLVGMTQEECNQFGWAEVLHPDDAADTIAAWKACVRTGGVWDREHRFMGTDGQWHHVLARGVPVRKDDGQVESWVGINLDISRLKHAQEALRDADRRKNEFLATLAHELRNPLAPVRNAIELLQLKGPDSAELKWARDVIARQVQVMARLIDDLMDVSRINRNKLELRKKRIDLATIVQGAIETSRPLIEQQGHELQLSLPAEPIPLEADVTRLAQVFSNLLNNAAKYTEPGGQINLAAERQGSEVRLSVRDNGIGIPADKLPSIFDLFSQVEDSLSRSQGGLGIGLSLVKRLVEMHGGSIEAHSKGLGKGSEFVVRLPVLLERAASEPSHDSTIVVPTSKLRILVVDDNRDAAFSLAALLKLLGNNIRTVHDGEEAVRAADEFRPHVVLLDIGLPKLNGYEAARQIRQEPWGKNMILIAVTGWGQEGDKRKSEEVGFDRHMVKPVDPALLMRLLASLNVVAT